jgi:hypothetical protein
VRELELRRILAANPDLVVEGWPMRDVAKHGKISEHEMQCAIIAECRQRALTNPEWAMIFAIPNGGHRHPAVAAKLKAEGLQAGLPDLCLPIAKHGLHSFWLELKVGKNNCSEMQRWWQRRLELNGHFVAVVRDNPQEAITLIEWWLER